MAKCKRALISVHDKQGVVELARALVELKVEILSTGGTARLLAENKIPLREVASVTGFPEMLDGRVKTLHPAIHGGILARRDDPKHMEELGRQGFGLIDLVVVNLYPFAETAARAEASPAELIEQIDIGGPTLIRAAAKNFASVGVVVSPEDYQQVIEELRAQRGLSLFTRLALARKAFAATAAYDSLIAPILEEIQVSGDALERQTAVARFPATLSLSGSKALDLRYGENPHQRAALYLTGDGIAGAKKLQGKELSYNNLLDLDSAWELAAEFTEPVAVIIKHTNPCGVAVAERQVDAYEKAYACDPVSAYGSVLAFNQPLTAATAEAMSGRFVEAIAAPGYEQAALDALAKKKNLRLLEINQTEGPEEVLGSSRAPSRDTRGDCRVRSISGGVLVQEKDVSRLDFNELRTVTERAPSAEEMQALLFAWLVCKHVKSNAIVYACGGQTLGVGAGQMSRVDAVKLGAQKAQLPLEGSVLASDAFFPFADGVEEAAKVGVTAVIQPGGSKRDQEVIDAGNRLGLAMVFTGVRHFRH